MTYRMTVSYSLDHYPALDQVLEAVLGSRDASGAGLGQRDCEWNYETEEERSQAESKLEPLLQRYPAAELDVMHGDIDDEEDEDEL